MLERFHSWLQERSLIGCLEKGSAVLVAHGGCERSTPTPRTPHASAVGLHARAPAPSAQYAPRVTFFAPHAARVSASRVSSGDLMDQLPKECARKGIPLPSYLSSFADLKIVFALACPDHRGTSLKQMLE